MKRKILVIRFSSLGDVVLTTALYPNIKAHWPDSEITVLTKKTFTPLFDNNPHVDHVRYLDESKQSFNDLCKEIRIAGYDVIIDLHNTVRSWYMRFVSSVPLTVAVNKNTLQRRFLVWFKRRSPSLDVSVRERILECLKPLEVPIVNTETHLYPTHVSRTLDTHEIDSKKLLIGIAPGAKHATKRWTREGFIEAANRLGAISDAQILFLGDKSDKPFADEIYPFVTSNYKNLVGWTDLSELMGIVSKLKLLLTNDSGILHIAEALKTPTVALFGPTVRAFGFAPYRKTSRVVEVANLPCRPCTLHGDESCPLTHHKCMKDLDVNAVMMSCSMLLDKVTAAQGSVTEGSL